MKILRIVAIVFLSVSCVQIPQQSIDLSQTMGHDIKSVYIAHINLVNLYFNSIEGDINDFVDDVYAPYQIGLLIEADLADFKDGLDNTLAGALRDAPDNPESAKEALQNMEIFVRLIREDIENYRNELLAPIRQQRLQIVTGLDKSYMNLISANESITAHLSSIKKVKDAQSELLEQLGLEADLNEQMGQKIADLSGKISNIISHAEKIDQKSDTAMEQFNAIKDTISNLTNH
jgi:hypothetical protein